MARCRPQTQAEEFPTHFPPEYFDDTPRPGFGIGIEFESCLHRAWEKHQNRKDGRIERYSRFGMTEEEAIRRTPEHIRDAYTKFIAEQLADDYTPTPSPSPTIPPTPKSIPSNHLDAAELSHSSVTLSQDVQKPSRPTGQLDDLLFQTSEQQPTPVYTASRSAKPMSKVLSKQNKAVVGSKIGKRLKLVKGGLIGNIPQSIHHMETRSGRIMGSLRNRTARRNPGLAGKVKTRGVAHN